ncbi:AbrB/MazE/SpoVT family DNA-binding domain-containing protein [Paenibacillus peoriae]|uniref:AbrB/MazE/SpoVT family DNA-binding domain-containing protein n=1 Tax=Paenibacillus peoriae TaxID=59893 RepID=A0A7H0Y1Y2_9BACL|nr:AbrB/MazE/SpoVT family DNA-binding domain-containing protein [Paenibacillus peoriae]QNR65090.1 AbrB/MazE/SpoVT family DNA-binding domain-containing protein [Paenibacillus peoriae]
MKYTGMTRPIDSLGRIVIPKEIRESMDYEIGGSVEFFLDYENNILSIKKHTGNTCKMCGSIKNLSKFKDSMICESCINEMKHGTFTIHTKKQQKSHTQLTIRKSRSSKEQQIEALKQIIKKKPNATQIEYAKLLGVGQSRISQLKKFMGKQ